MLGAGAQPHQHDRRGVLGRNGAGDVGHVVDGVGTDRRGRPGARAGPGCRPARSGPPARPRRPAGRPRPGQFDPKTARPDVVDAPGIEHDHGGPAGRGRRRGRDMIPKSRPGPRDLISSTTSSPSGPPTTALDRPGSDHRPTLSPPATPASHETMMSRVASGTTDLSGHTEMTCSCPAASASSAPAGGKPLPHRPLGRALGPQQGQHVAGRGPWAGLEGQLAPWPARWPRRTPCPGPRPRRPPSRPRRRGYRGPGPRGTPIAAGPLRAGSCGRCRRGPTARARPGAHSPQAHAGQRGAQAHAHHEDLAGPAGPQQVDGGAAPTLARPAPGPGRRPRRPSRRCRRSRPGARRSPAAASRSPRAR